jgi:uncharacterized membrane protein
MWVSSSSAERAVDGVFALFYFMVLLSSVTQLGRIVFYTRRKFKLDLMASEHICVAIISLFRCVTLLLRAQLCTISHNNLHLALVDYCQ